MVAQGCEVQHKNVLELIRNNQEDFEEFGGVAFETRPFETAGGVQERTYAILNEEQAALLMTYMRNSPVVKDFQPARAFRLARIVVAASMLAFPEFRYCRACWM
ncbi:Rha family transcriptional regulator [Mycobacterium sp. MS3]|uniref:Rha family transcriptional regulator n=1 Tax=Mycobacterium sp. MS3 TaxID=3391378 RepID=UPI003988CF22